MVIFNSYVKLPEGKSEELFLVSLATEIVASHTLSAQRTTCIIEMRRKSGPFEQFASSLLNGVLFVQAMGYS